jgi:predicted ester cyclase
MKKIVYVLITIFFISCNDSGTTTTTGNTSETSKNLEANRKVYRAIETGDAATLDSFIAKDAVDHQGPNGTEVKGDDSVKHMLADMHNHVNDLKMEMITAAANGDYVFTLANFSGTVKDGFMGMPAGAAINERGVDVVKIKDGKMTEHWGFVDPAAMMKNMPPIGDHKMDMKAGEKMEKKDSTKK